MIDAIVQYQFMRSAVLGVLLAGVLTGIIGAVIVEKRWIMLSSGIAHSSFGGIGLGYLLGFEPIYGAFLFAVLSALVIPAVDRRTDTGSENLTAMLWSFGMALGILFIAFTPGYPPDMTSYLFGNILTISMENLVMMALITSVVVAVLIGFYNTWKVYLFDHEFATIIGLPVKLMDSAVFLLIAVSVVALIKTAGIILIIALLTIPPSIARFFARSFSKLILYSIGLGLGFSLTGLTLSYYTNIPSGATIILVSIATYGLIVSARRLRSHRQ